MINKRSLIIYTLANLIFFISQIVFLCNRISFVQTNWFVYLFIADMALFILWCIMIMKSCTRQMKLIDGIGMIIILFSMFCITSLAYNWNLLSMTVAGVTGYAAIAIGILGRIKHSLNGCNAYVLWGIYVLIWTINWYNACY